MQCDGMKIMTTEGLEVDGALAPIQKAFLDEGAFQCGFCTSGMLMSSQAFIQETKSIPTEMQIRESIEGNICRCTGYNSIVRAIDAVIKGKYAEGK
jgi:carbon-monoxide dehydrogenase small subunit